MAMQQRSLARRGALSAPSAQRRPARQLTTVVRADSCLIVNTKGGGHAFIGLHLAKQLLKKGHSVTIMNDGEQAKLEKKAPFNKYADLARSGVKITYGSPADPSTYPAGRYDIIVDNNGKDMASCKPLIDHFKNKISQHIFVSSAGAYKADSIEPGHWEGDARKSSAGHVEVEEYLKQQRVPYTVFQPLYIYGPFTAKDCEQWFLDRIVRDRPVPIPAPGVQLTTLTHVEDVASMIAAAAGNRKALYQSYNVCSDRCITFQGIVDVAAKALGKEAKVKLYSPEKLGLGKGGKAEGFPFRTVHFFANADKAQRELKWKPQHNFASDIKDLVADYKAQGRDKKEVDFTIDDKILAA